MINYLFIICLVIVLTLGFSKLFNVNIPYIMENHKKIIMDKKEWKISPYFILSKIDNKSEYRTVNVYINKDGILRIKQ